MNAVTCSAPPLTVGQKFNGGVLLAESPLRDQSGKYPGRVVLVDLGTEWVTWVAAWPADREDPVWYCTGGDYFLKQEGFGGGFLAAATNFDMRAELNY